MEFIGGHIDGNHRGHAEIDPIFSSSINVNAILYICICFFVECLFHNGEFLNCVEAY